LASEIRSIVYIQRSWHFLVEWRPSHTWLPDQDRCSRSSVSLEIQMMINSKVNLNVIDLSSTIRLTVL